MSGTNLFFDRKKFDGLQVRYLVSQGFNSTWVNSSLRDMPDAEKVPLRGYASIYDKFTEIRRLSPIIHVNGPPATGKSFVTQIFMAETWRGKLVSPFFVTAEEVCFTNGKQDRVKYDKAVDAAILALDDIDAVIDTDYQLKTIRNLIVQRRNASKVTLLIGRLDTAQVIERMEDFREYFMPFKFRNTPISIKNELLELLKDAQG